MLSGILGKKSDHPMADIRSAQTLLEDLPKNDAHKLLMELSDWIESVAENADFKLDHQFAVLRLLDEAAQPYLRKLVREYFSPNEPSKFQENRLWMVLGNYSRHAATGYLNVFNGYIKGDKGSNAVKPLLPLLLVRTVNAMISQSKYLCVRYNQINPAVWKNAAQIYHFAEQFECLNTPVNLYPGLPGNTSVKSEVGHFLGWYGCGVNTLQPLYMHLTERIVAQYCTAIDVHAQLGGQDLFTSNLNRPSAPMRVKVDATVHPAMRFVSMAAMQPQLESLIKTLAKKVVPEDLDMGGTYSGEVIREAAQFLLNYIVSPPLRKGVRHTVKLNMNVVHGFLNTVERTNAGLNFNEEQPSQWELEDISTNGFRTVLPARGSDDVRIGGVLGVKPTGAKNWGVAVVRRMMRDDNNMLHVGAEMLTNQITAVALVQSGEGGGAFEDGQTALWLQEKQGDYSGDAKLLMKADSFSGHRSLLSEMNGEDYLLIPNGLVEKCFDCDLVKFRLVKQESSPDSYL